MTRKKNHDREHAQDEGAETTALPVEEVVAVESVPEPAPEPVPEPAPEPVPEPVPEPEAAPAPAPSPEPLREDGPTLAEFVAAGYSAENYPPEGYAPREEVLKADDEAQPTRNSKRTAG